MSRIAQEKRIVEQMIRLYCRRKEGNQDLCPECRPLRRGEEDVPPLPRALL